MLRQIKDTTLLVVAHRISTIQDLDWVIVLDAGKVIEQGRPEELLKADSHFARLALARA